MSTGSEISASAWPDGKPGHLAGEGDSKDVMSTVRSLSCRFLRAQSTWSPKSKNRKQLSCLPLTLLFFSKGGVVAQSVERATPVEEVPGSIPTVAARSLLVGSVSV